MKNANRIKYVAALLASSVLATSTGCSLSRGPAVPAELSGRAEIPGLPNVRTWSDELSPEFLKEIERASRKEFELLKAEGHTGELPTANYLAISGGGANGAYGAGLLCGWTAAGTRPKFKLVTGISTGALSAPFAFVGSKEDATLREVYTSIRTKDIMEPRNLLAGLTGDALTDNAPLWKLLGKHINEKLLAEIAAEYNRGNLLLVGTTDLDAQRGVIWNMGAIASSGHPRALELFRSILIASAAIPAAFPPVMMDVVVDGKKYQEMHVDGGAISQVFVYPPTLDLGTLGIQRKRCVYVLRNGRLDPSWAEVNRQTMKIASRAIDSLIQTQGMGDLYRIYLTSLRDHVEFKLAYIPPTFREKPQEAFDPVYMKKLFDIGYEGARNGQPWMSTPPGYVVNSTAGSPEPRPSSGG